MALVKRNFSTTTRAYAAAVGFAAALAMTLALALCSMSWARAAAKSGRAQGSPTTPAQTIRLHPKNAHYFLFRGKAVALVTSGEHYGAVINGDFDYGRYLTALAGEGLNFTRIFGGSYVEAPGKSFGILRNDLAPGPGRYIAPWARSDVAGYAGGGNKFDLERWDVEYFRRLHEFLKGASERGIVVEISLFSAHYGDLQWELSALNPANNVNMKDAGIADYKKLHTLENGGALAYQERYTRKLVREAGGFDNVIFEIQNEPWADRPAAVGAIGLVNPMLQGAARDRFPNTAELADELSLAWQAKVAEWITSEEATLPNKHLIAQNISNFRFPIRKLLAGVSIANFHYADADAAAWNYGLDKALSCDETGFMGRDDELYRREAWNFMLAGGEIFDGLDYSFSVGHEDGTDTEANGPGGGSAALRHELRVLSEFLQSFELAELHPEARAVRHSTGTVARVLSNAGREYAMYFDGDGPTEVTLDLPEGRYSGEWVNVRTGRVERAEEIRGGLGVVVESPKFVNGIALRVKRR
jgi:hypothetical protein